MKPRIKISNENVYNLRERENKLIVKIPSKIEKNNWQILKAEKAVTTINKTSMLILRALVWMVWNGEIFIKGILPVAFDGKAESAISLHSIAHDAYLKNYFTLAFHRHDTRHKSTLYTHIFITFVYKLPMILHTYHNALLIQML